MAYDEELADRIRGLLGEERAVSEQRMFGGLARVGRAAGRCHPSDADPGMTQTCANTLTATGDD